MLASFPTVTIRHDHEKIVDRDKPQTQTKLQFLNGSLTVADSNSVLVTLGNSSDSSRKQIIRDILGNLILS